MASIRRGLLSQNVNLIADDLRLPIPGSPPELVHNPLHEGTPLNRRVLRWW